MSPKRKGPGGKRRPSAGEDARETVESTAPEEEVQESPPEPPPGGETGVEERPEALQEEIRRLHEELDTLRDRHLRLAADFDNYRRRVNTEMSESWTRAQADLVRGLLEVVDDLERVSHFDPDTTTTAALLEGVQLVERKLQRILADAGLQVVDPAGEPFDPNTMEAMMRVPAESEEDDDRVQQVLQKGYLFRDHLVRPARVSVFKAD